MGSCTVAHSTVGGTAPAISSRNHSHMSVRDDRSKASGKRGSADEVDGELGVDALDASRSASISRALRRGWRVRGLPGVDNEVREEGGAVQVVSTRVGSTAVRDGARSRSWRPSRLPHKSKPKRVRRRRTEDGDASPSAEEECPAWRVAKKDQRSPPSARTSTNGTSWRTRSSVSR